MRKDGDVPERDAAHVQAPDGLPDRPCLGAGIWSHQDAYGSGPSVASPSAG